MPTARSIVEWVAFALLKLAATGAAVSGIAFLAASGAVQAAGAVGGVNAGWVRLVIAGSLGVAVVLLVTGGISLYLRRASLTWLPDTPGSSQAPTGSGFDGWLILFPLTLLAVPALMLVQLQPLVAFWRDVLALADRLNFWEELQRNTADSGYVLIPVFSALALPGIAAAAAVATFVESVLLIALLFVRSTSVPRALLLCVILQGGLVFTTVVGAAIVDRLTPSIEQLIRSTPDPVGAGQAQFLTAIERYSAVVRGASRTLAWGWAAMVMWTPLLLLSALGRATFTAIPRPAQPADRALDYSAMDDEARERAYRDAAKQVDRTTRASRWS